MKNFLSTVTGKHEADDKTREAVNRIGVAIESVHEGEGAPGRAAMSSLTVGSTTEHTKDTKSVGR